MCDSVSRIEIAAGRLDFAAREHGRGGAVAEQRGRNQVRGRQVGALHAQAGQLDGDDQRAGLRKADQEVARARQRRRAARAPELGDRQPAHVGPQPEVVDQVGVERRDHDPGARGRDDQIDVRRADLRRRQRLPGHLASEPEGVLAVALLDVAERARDAEPVDRFDAVAPLDGGVVEQLHRGVEAPRRQVEHLAQPRLHLRLGGGERRHRRGGADDGRQPWAGRTAAAELIGAGNVSLDVAVVKWCDAAAGRSRRSGPPPAHQQLPPGADRHGARRGVRAVRRRGPPLPRHDRGGRRVRPGPRAPRPGGCHRGAGPAPGARVEPVLQRGAAAARGGAVPARVRGPRVLLQLRDARRTRPR